MEPGELLILLMRDSKALGIENPLHERFPLLQTFKFASLPVLQNLHRVKNVRNRILLT